MTRPFHYRYELLLPRSRSYLAEEASILSPSFLKRFRVEYGWLSDDTGAMLSSFINDSLYSFGSLPAMGSLLVPLFHRHMSWEF